MENSTTTANYRLMFNKSDVQTPFLLIQTSDDCITKHVVMDPKIVAGQRFLSLYKDRRLKEMLEQISKFSTAIGFTSTVSRQVLEQVDSEILDVIDGPYAESYTLVEEDDTKAVFTSLDVLINNYFHSYVDNKSDRTRNKKYFEHVFKELKDYNKIKANVIVKTANQFIDAVLTMGYALFQGNSCGHIEPELDKLENDFDPLSYGNTPPKTSLGLYKLLQEKKMDVFKMLADGIETVDTLLKLETVCLNVENLRLTRKFKMYLHYVQYVLGHRLGYDTFKLEDMVTYLKHSPEKLIGHHEFIAYVLSILKEYDEPTTDPYFRTSSLGSEGHYQSLNVDKLCFTIEGEEYNVSPLKDYFHSFFTDENYPCKEFDMDKLQNLTEDKLLDFYIALYTEVCKVRCKYLTIPTYESRYGILTLILRIISSYLMPLSYKLGKHTYPYEEAIERYESKYFNSTDEVGYSQYVLVPFTCSKTI